MFTKLGDESGLVRWGGLGGVAAGVMFVLAGILNLIAPTGGQSSIPLVTTSISSYSSWHSR